VSDANLIRTILARECDTVNEYEALAARAQDPKIRNLILHFAEEEKEHIAECALVLARIDSQYATYLNKSLTHIDEAWAEPNEPSEPNEPNEPATPNPTPAVAPETETNAPVDARSVDVPGVTLASGIRLTNDPYAQTVGSLFRAPTKR